MKTRDRQLKVLARIDAIEHRAAIERAAKAIRKLNLRVKPAKTYLPNPHTQKL